MRPVEIGNVQLVDCYLSGLKVCNDPASHPYGDQGVVKTGEAAEGRRSASSRLLQFGLCHEAG